MKIKLKNILKAKHEFGNFINSTPLVHSERLSNKYKSNIYLKREDLQPVRSYKIRGAFNLINSLTNTERNAGVVCASAGNHAQGVAITCNHLKIKGTIFMPITTPEQKVYKTKQFGGDFIKVILIGDTFDEAFIASKKFETENGSTFVHPFDDERIIIGQATIGLEIFEEMEIDPDYIICPIGGGGVVSGLISITKDLDKKTRIIGVEPEGALSMKTSLKGGKNTTLEKIDIFVDGASVARVGEKTYQIAKDYGLEVIECPEDRVCSTILEYLKEDGIVIEPAGALSTDALKNLKKEIKGKNIVLIISGGNFDFERLQEVKERSMRFEGLKRYFVVSFPQRPGALKDFLSCLGKNDDIARFEYLKKSNKNRAPVFIGIETDKKENWEIITNKMENLGFKHHDVTNDELYFDLLV